MTSPTALPQPDSKIKILTYADDITIAAQGTQVKSATAQLQTYLNTLQDWLTVNRLSVSPTNSTTNLFTPDFRKHSNHTVITLFNSQLPLDKTPKILGLTFDTHMTF